MRGYEYLNYEHEDKTHQERLEMYRKEAYDYFSSVGICPTGDEIAEFVCEAIEDESGCEVDDDGYRGIAKRLGITID
jgi:hypothetical protein